MQKNNEDLLLSEFQKKLCNIIAGLSLVLCGLFLLLCGAGAIPLRLKDVFLPSVLFSVALTLFITAFVQKNSVALWLSILFLVPAIVLFVDAFSALGQAELYPFYIAIPSIASLFCLPASQQKRLHIIIIAFFFVLAAIFALESFGALGWNTVLPILVVYVGAAVVAAVFLTKKCEEN